MQQQFDRLDVAEFNRRIEAMSSRVGEMATQLAVMAEREKQMATDMTTMQRSVDELKDTLARGRGAVYILTVSAGLFATIIGFWDKVPKPWGH